MPAEKKAIKKFYAFLQLSKMQQRRQAQAINSSSQ